MSIEIKTRAIDTVEPKQYSVTEPPYFLVSVYLVATANECENIQVVKYTLPPAFKEQNRVSQQPPNYPIEVWTPGFFDIVADVYLKDGSVQQVSGRVTWDYKQAYKVSQAF